MTIWQRYSILSKPKVTLTEKVVNDAYDTSKLLREPNSTMEWNLKTASVK